MAINEQMANFIRNYRDVVKGYAAAKTALAADKERREKEAANEINKIWNEPVGTRGTKGNSGTKTLDSDISDTITNVLNKLSSGFIDTNEYQKNLNATNQALRDRGIIGGGTENASNEGLGTLTESYSKVNGNVINPADQYTWGNANAGQAANTETTTENADDFVEYTYKPGDTFGQVILDLGIDTNKGLWGSDGDVAFYTKQLREQGIPGMVPIGTKIRLKKRK